MKCHGTQRAGKRWREVFDRGRKGRRFELPGTRSENDAAALQTQPRRDRTCGGRSCPGFLRCWLTFSAPTQNGCWAGEECPLRGELAALAAPVIKRIGRIVPAAKTSLF